MATETQIRLPEVRVEGDTDRVHCGIQALSEVQALEAAEGGIKMNLAFYKNEYWIDSGLRNEKGWWVLDSATDKGRSIIADPLQIEQGAPLVAGDGGGRQNIGVIHRLDWGQA